jgi:hypothetical protein
VCSIILCRRERGLFPGVLIGHGCRTAVS